MAWTNQKPVIEGQRIMTEANKYIVDQDGKKILVGRRWSEANNGG